MGINKTRLVCLFAGLIVMVTAFFPAAAQAGVSTSPNTLDFGSVTVSKTSTAMIMLTNNSRQSIALQSVLSSLPQFTVSGPALPMTLGPRTGVIFHVVFAPSSVASFTGSIYFTAGKKGGETI